jgi:hypothetical protein
MQILSHSIATVRDGSCLTTSFFPQVKVEGSVDSQALVAAFEEQDINVEGRTDFIQKCACTEISIHSQQVESMFASLIHVSSRLVNATDLLNAGLVICHDFNLTAEDVVLKIHAAIVNNDIQGGPKGKFMPELHSVTQ